MSFKEFANGFKQIVAEYGKLGQKLKIYARNAKTPGDVLVSYKQILAPETDYTFNYNSPESSVVIDSWYAVLTGKSDVLDENNKLLMGGGILSKLIYRQDPERLTFLPKLVIPGLLS